MIIIFVVDILIIIIFKVNTLYYLYSWLHINSIKYLINCINFKHKNNCINYKL